MKIKIFLASLMFATSLSAMAEGAVIGPSNPCAPVAVIGPSNPCKPVAVIGPAPIKKCPCY
ncbi:hypothetical protein [Burkholderia pyrrocinia]|uniref:Uncharacterized protein n=1 Tax=Burkholderia pyrrocinia TaxID=60550 RepID=A0ABZ3BQK9_BURPY